MLPPPTPSPHHHLNRHTSVFLLLQCSTDSAATSPSPDPYICICFSLGCSVFFFLFLRGILTILALAPAPPCIIRYSPFRFKLLLHPRHIILSYHLLPPPLPHAFPITIPRICTTISNTHAHAYSPPLVAVGRRSPRASQQGRISYSRRTVVIRARIPSGINQYIRWFLPPCFSLLLPGPAACPWHRTCVAVQRLSSPAKRVSASGAYLPTGGVHRTSIVHGVGLSSTLSSASLHRLSMQIGQNGATPGSRNPCIQSTVLLVTCPPFSAASPRMLQRQARCA